MKEETDRIPLRTILSNFLNHIDTLENQWTPDNTYESEFQELKLFSESIKGTKQYSCSEGEKEVNRKKNRYKDILPFDVSRVVLNEYAGVPGSDYINANYIKGASGSPAYIASQGPLPHTVNDFWRMVVQCEVQVIVMACNEEEAGKHKCENYWVEAEGEEKQFGMVSLRLIKASTVCPDFSVRTMRLKYTNTQSNTEERTVCQFHYSAWPDHSVPPLVRPLLDMVRLVRDTQASETLPVLIHCSTVTEERTVCQFHYSAWPDHGVPPLVRPLLDMVRLVRDTQASETLPVLIHCSTVTEERTVCQFHYSAWPDHGVPPLVRPLLDMVRLVRDTQASETLPVLIHCSTVTEERTVCQFHYSAWPDHGVPPLVRPLLDMVRLVRDTQASETLPVLIHCSTVTEERTVCQFHYSAWPDHGVPPLVRPLLDMVRLVRDTQASETLPVLIHCSTVTEERTVCQFHYSAWPDHGVPPLVRPLLDMVRLVRDTQASETLPVLIHCSAGCGRTGTICAIDYVWGLLRAGKLTKDFSLLSLVREMRRQRIAMVQTKEQYVLVHQAVRELFREQLRMIDSHPYENIDCNGLPLIKCPSPELEPTYDSLLSFQNNKTEEKQDEREKEQAPPLPQKLKLKKRFQTLSSKQAKEVENLSERQRLVERAGFSESVSSPRIATLRSLFERQHATRDSRQVARSHSLGSVRPPPQPNPVLQKPIPGRGILRVPQTQAKPALPVKRSKSLRVLGSSDHCKLSIPSTPAPPCTREMDLPRRLSLESNYDEIKELVEGETQQPLTDYLSVDSIVAGLGVRERRNSFRQAVRKESQDSVLPRTRKPGLLRSYTSIDMRCAREKPNITQDTPPSKPLLRPKPNLQLSSTSDGKRLLSDPRQHSQDPPLPASVTSRSLTVQSMSLRLAPRPKREDCRVLLSPTIARSAMPQRPEQVCSSGESSLSASSEHGSSSSKGFPPTSSRTVKPLLKNTNSEFTDKEVKVQPSSQHQIVFSPRSYDNANTVYVSSSAEQTPTGRPTAEQSHVFMHHRMKSLSEMRKHTPLQNVRPVAYDSKGLRQHPSAVYGTVTKTLPPPYVEPGKNAQKPRSSPLSNIEKQSGYHDDTYGMTPDKRHVHIGSSSRDMVLQSYASNGKPNSTGTDVRLSSHEPSSMKYSRTLTDKIQSEPDYRLKTQEHTNKKSDGQEYRFLPQESHPVHITEHRYQEQEGNLRNERRHLEQDHHKTTQDNGSKIPVERQHKEMDQAFRLEKSSSSRRIIDPNPQIIPHNQHSKSGLDRQEHSIKHVHDPFYREKRLINQGYHHSSPHEPLKSGDKKTKEQGASINLQDPLHLTNERVTVNQNNKSSVQELYVSSVERRYAPNYHSSSQDLNPKTPSDWRPVGTQEHGYQHNRQNPRTGYMSRGPPVQQQSARTPVGESSNRDRQGKEAETPVIYGVKMRRGSRDDLALCASVPSRVKRHASVVLLRHSLIEGATSNPDSAASPLSVWSEISAAGGDQVPSQASQTPVRDDPWSGAVGVDLDQVAASITSQKDGKMMRAALEALHLRKASRGIKSSAGSTPETQPSARPSQATPAGRLQVAPNSDRPGVYRKQQQYL